MNYEFNVEQRMLRDSARNFFSKECDSEMVRELVTSEDAYHEKLWRKMAGLGWMGLLIPQSCDGEDMALLDMAILLHEMGYACFPSPFFSTAVAGVLMMLAAASEEQKKTILSKVATGKHLLSLAWAEEGTSYGTDGIRLRAEKSSGEFLLSGTKKFVPDARVADTLLCVARVPEEKEQADLYIFMVDLKSKGVRVRPRKTFTGEKLFDIDLVNVRIPESNLLGNRSIPTSMFQHVLLKAAVGKCAEMVGNAQRVLEMTLEHAKTRIQFGRPVGSFQAVQHHCANMLTYLETSRYMMYQAAWQISENLPFEKAASMSKAWVSDSCRRLVALGHQVMGGLGFMEEIDLHLYFNRVKAAELAFGDADIHREYVARQLEKA